jgi:hypothetical protein
VLRSKVPKSAAAMMIANAIKDTAIGLIVAKLLAQPPPA